MGIPLFFFWSAKINYINNEVPEVLRIQRGINHSHLVPKTDYNQSQKEPETEMNTY